VPRTSKKQAIRNAFFCLGLHTTPKVIVYALKEQGILVDEELVRQVRFELLKKMTGAKIDKNSRPISPPVRRWPQGFGGDKRGR